jgi:transposase
MLQPANHVLTTKASYFFNDLLEAELPPLVRSVGQLYLVQIAACSELIVALEKKLRAAAARLEETARLQTMPGIGPISAMAVRAFAP